MKQLKLKLILTVLMSMASINAFSDVVIDGISYIFSPYKDEAMVTANPNNYQGNVVIPSFVYCYQKKWRVTSIGTEAFKDCSGLTSVTIPNSVTWIGESAFEGCSGLTSIEIPNSVTSIGERAFLYCSGLTSIEIPNSVTTIGDFAFWSCSSLTSVTLDSNAIVSNNYSYGSPSVRSLERYFGSQVQSYIIGNSVTSIGNQAFYECSGLTSVTIGNSVTSIDKFAFEGCSSLTSVTIGNSVTSIGYGAFKDCSGLTTVTINSKALVSKDYSSEYPSYSSLKDYFGSQVQRYIIGNSVTRIGNYAFEFCSGLTSVTIGNSVTSIGNNAFWFCSGLTSIDIPNSVTSIGESAFEGCSGLTTVTINSNALVSKDYSSEYPPYSSLKDYFGSQVQRYIIGNSVTRIGNCAFRFCSGLTSVMIGNCVTSIGNHAFWGCSGLTSIDIPNSVTSIDFAAFYKCSGLSSVTIGNSVTSISIGAFDDCSGLTTVTINSNALVSKDYYFSSGNLLDSSLKDYFGSQIQHYIIGNSVTSIGNGAFYKCSGLTSIKIPNSVTSIGFSAFRDCSGLTSVTIGNSVTSIGESAFSGCSGLASVTIPSSVRRIYDHAFSRCSGLTSIEIPNSVTSIGVAAFYGCSGLASVTIPSSVRRIYDHAFSGCNNLTTVAVENEVPIEITSEVFPNRANAMLLVPIGCLATYKAADYWKEFKVIIAPIDFKDANLEAICLANWDEDNDGMLNTEEAAAVKDLGTVFKGNTTITSFDELRFFIGLTSIGNEAFMGCSNLYRITIPNSVTSIGNEAFMGCSNLYSITIPNSVTSIGGYVVAGCNNLTTVTVKNEVPIKITSEVFSNCAKTKLLVPQGSLAAYKAADYWKEFKDFNENIAFADANTKAVCVALDENYDEEMSMEEAAGTSDFLFTTGPLFKGKTTITSFDELRYFTGLTYIGYEDFRDCSNLTSITIPINVTRIGDYAFEGCSRLTSVKIYAKTPPAVAINAFPINNQSIILYVCRGSKAAYETADVWKNFSSIVEFDDIIKGDANGDGEVNVSDIVEIVNYIMNKPSDKFVFAAADLNGDGEVNVTDIVKVVSIIMSSSNNAPKRAAVAEMADNDQLEMTSKDSKTLSLNLQNEGSYVASQFDIVLSASQTLEGIQLNSKRMANHQMTYTKTGDNRYKVVIYSLNNAAYKGQSGELLNIKVAGSGDVSVEDILFVTAGQMEKNFPPLRRGTTGISLTTNEAETMDIYSIDGRLIRKQAKSTDGLEKGLYIINGKKQIVR